MLKYYQWTPFILLFMALCFYFPRMLWRSLNNKSGLDIEKLVDAAMKQEQENQSEEREKTVDYIVDSIRVYIENRYTGFIRPNSHGKTVPEKLWYYITFWRHRHLSSFIFILFTTVKFLFLLNSVVQIFLLNTFLGNEYHLFGFEVVGKFLRGLDWGESKRFPRVTLCDFHIREIGIVHRYTVQCVLPINLFNEKIFLALWFWILILSAFNIGDFLFWIWRIANVENRSNYVQRKLAMSQKLNRLEEHDGNNPEQVKFNRKQMHRRFVKDYLQADGCFALRLLARNGQDIIVGQIIEKLYTHYRTMSRTERENHDRTLPSGTHTFHNSSYGQLPSRDQSLEIPTQHDDQRLLVKPTSN